MYTRSEAVDHGRDRVVFTSLDYQHEKRGFIRIVRARGNCKALDPFLFQQSCQLSGLNFSCTLNLCGA